MENLELSKKILSRYDGLCVYVLFNDALICWGCVSEGVTTLLAHVIGVARVLSVQIIIGT